MKHKRLLAAGVVGVGIMAALFSQLPQTLPVAVKGLPELADGRYQGSCENGLVAVEVEVVLAAGRLTEIKLLKHRNGFGSQGEQVVEAIIAEQSLAVEAVAGATYSSQTIIKAVENALGGTR